MSARYGKMFGAMGMSACLLAGCAARGDFRLASLDGQEVALSDYRGKVVLMAFWAGG